MFPIGSSPSKTDTRRRLDPNAPVLGRMGTLEVRLARTRSEIRAAQALRYRVFYGEMGARGGPTVHLLRRDKDPFDCYCDHLLVIDRAESKSRIVGTYRLLAQEQAELAGGFYSQSEFDLTPLFQRNPNARFLELGRSCILPAYRTKRTIELLWHGTWRYSVNHRMDVLFGCASFEGTDPAQLAPALGWLSQNARLCDEESCAAAAVDRVALNSFDQGPIDQRRAFNRLPPLLKGYLRVGAKVGADAVIDHRFGTTDVLVVLKVCEINPRYLVHFGADASRFAA